MAKDSLQPTWKKTLSGVITAIGVDNNGTVWAGDGAGKLSRFTSDGISSEPIYLDNPICSISVDKNTNDIYVGDLANNVYKYTSNGERKWGKNLGTGSIDAISIISTINNIKPDDNGNFDLTDKYYSQEQINSLIAPLGKTKTVNGNVPDDTGNITVDLSGYYAYKGAINDDSDLDKNLATGWYALHSSNGSTSILLVYSGKNVSGLQVRISPDKSISVRYQNGGKYTDWELLTNNVKSINNISPDKDGNVDLDLTGNIKTVNRIKPDKDGNIQLGAGSINSVKSINNNYYPDETGNVQVPEFSLNLLPNTSDEPTEIKPNATSKGNNYWQSEKGGDNNGRTYSSHPIDDAGINITAETPVEPNTNYIASFSAWTLLDSIGSNELSGHYTMWRNPKITFYVICKDDRGYVIATYKYKYHFKQEDNQYQGYISLSFYTPAKTATVSLWYNGLERTDDNMILESNSVTTDSSTYNNSHGKVSNSDDQTIELKPMSLVDGLVGKDVSIRIQAYVTNYKKGSFFTLKTKDMDGNAFKLDSSNLDSNNRLIKSIPDIDESNLITGNGFYSWDYVMSADELFNIKSNEVIPTTNVVGDIVYTVKIVENDGTSNPDMEFTGGITRVTSNPSLYYYPECSFNKLSIFNLELYNKDTANVVDLATYKFSDINSNNLANTVGKYSASCVLDMKDSTGFCRLVLQKYDTKTDTVISEEASKKLPIISTDDSGVIEVVERSICRIDGLQNDNPKSTEAIRLRAYIYGQTSAIYINKVKLAKWADDDTPPDLNWLPNLNDIGKVQSVNGTLPDSTGDIVLHGIDNPDYVYSSSDTLDVDGATETGIYRFMDSTVISSMRKDALDGLPRTTSATSMCGYLFVMKHDNFNRDQLLILNGGTEQKDITIATRSISGVNLYRPRFRKILNADDYIGLQSYVRDLTFMNDDAGRNIYSTTINLDTYTTVGITHFLGCKLKSVGEIPDFSTYADKSCYGWIVNIPRWSNAMEYDTLLYITGDTTANSDSALYMRSASASHNTSWIKLSTNDDLSKGLKTVNTFNNPVVIIDSDFNKKWLDSLSDSGIYYVNCPSSIDDADLLQLPFSTDESVYLFSSINKFQKFAKQVLVQVANNNKLNIIYREGTIDDKGAITFNKWYSATSDTDNIRNDLANFKDAVNDKFKSIDVVKYSANEEDAINHSKQTRGVFYYWY